MDNVPTPIVSKRSLLIKVVNSCISAGTEISTIRSSGTSLLKRAFEQPKQLKKVLENVKEKGVVSTYKTISGVIDSGKPIGYSLSGVVVDVGDEVNGFKKGDFVAAAGAGVANHAEFVVVPENLVVKLPNDVSFRDASSVAIGSIALHGVRRADLKIGEYCVILGAGIIGLLTVQMLIASGVRVAVIDIDDFRLKIAKALGAEIVVNSSKKDAVVEVENWTGGYGADCVLFTASTQNSGPLSSAFNMCRRKGKVVLVGVSGMNINRDDIYKKELDFQISTSYGPGRYDKKYEEKNLDYPYAYIRWTEKRNMTEYLRLIASGKLKLDALITGVYKIGEAEKAFTSIKDNSVKSIMTLLDYGEIDKKSLDSCFTIGKKVVLNSAILKDKKIINVGIIGAGGFAINTHLPNIEKLKNKYSVCAVCNRTSSVSKNVAKQYNANYATSDYNDLLKDDNIDLIMICTRHENHGRLVLEALKAGKNVFVEKPLCTDKLELEKIKSFFQKTKTPPFLTVGYNRRFSPIIEKIKDSIVDRSNPLFIQYRMNAGYISSDSWVHEYGGRIVGEACHIIDLMTFLTGSKIVSVQSESITASTDKFSDSDNKSVVLKYEDGSLAVIEYFSMGSKKMSKEYMEIHFDEKSIIMDDYRFIKGYGVNLDYSSKKSRKGHLEEIERLYLTLSGKISEWPIDLWDIVQTSEISLGIR